MGIRPSQVEAAELTPKRSVFENAHYKINFSLVPF
jgi:hypothetical protein